MINKETAIKFAEKYKGFNIYEIESLSGLSQETIKRYLRKAKEEQNNIIVAQHHTINEPQKISKELQADLNLAKTIKERFTTAELKTILSSSTVKDPSIVRKQLSYNKSCITIGVLSDLHIGHVQFDEEDVYTAFKEFENAGVDFITISGDITEGMSNRNGHIYELNQVGYKAQRDKAVEILSEAPAHIYTIDGNHDCLSDDTEVLTSSGWKFYTEILESDKILSYTESGCKWDKINKVLVKEYSGEMIHIENNHLDMLMTPNHRVLHSPRVNMKFKPLEYKKAIELNNRVAIPVASTNNNKISALSDNEIKLLGWILTDGACKNNKCRIYQSKDLTKITTILDNLNIEYKIHTRFRESKEICGKAIKTNLPDNTIIFKYSLPNKYPFPEECYKFNDYQFEIFLNSLIDGDGSRYSNRPNTFILYGVKEFLDNIQTLCVLHGYRANITYDKRTKSPRLNISKHTTTQLDIQLHKTTPEYSGNVWCLSVPETNFMVRRNGKPFFTGNCWHVKANGAYIVEDICNILDGCTYLGSNEGSIIVDGVEIRLWHGEDGASSYALSYRLQKIIESLAINDRPAIIISGHDHKAIWMPENQGITCIGAGCIEKQTKWMRGKRIPAHHGFWIIKVYIDNGTLAAVEGKWHKLS